MRLASFLGLAILAAPQAVAQDLSLRPASCVRVATAQYDNCSIDNIFRCSDDGIAFWIESLDANDLLTIETRNSDHGSLSVDFVGQGVTMFLSQSKAHPRDTILNGTAEDTITGEFELFGMKRPIFGETKYGHAGETAVLAGVTFARIAFNGIVTLPQPMPAMTGGGTYLYSDALDLLIEEEVLFDGGAGVEPYRLAHLSLPDQAGFGDETPGYGCGELSQLSRRSTEAPA